MNRDIITNTFTSMFNDIEMDYLFDRIEMCKNTDQFIIQYVNETVLLYDTSSDLYLSWYKLTHIGRAYHTNILDLVALQNFLTELKEDIMWR